MGESCVKGGNTAIGQPHQNNRNYHDIQINYNNFHPFLMFLFTPFVILQIVTIFFRRGTMCSFFFFRSNCIILNNSVCSRERTTVPWEWSPALVTCNKSTMQEKTILPEVLCATILCKKIVTFLILRGFSVFTPRWGTSK